MNRSGTAASLLASRTQAFRDVAARVKAWLIAQIRQTVDRSAWTQASSWRERLAAVSWPRASVLAAIMIGPLTAAWLIYAAFRPVAYPPPPPSRGSIELYADVVREVKPAPPPGLVEANKTWTGEP